MLGFSRIAKYCVYVWMHSGKFKKKIEMNVSKVKKIKAKTICLKFVSFY